MLQPSTMCQASALPKTAENTKNIPHPTTYPSPPPASYPRRELPEAGEWGRQSVGERLPVSGDARNGLRHVSGVDGGKILEEFDGDERTVSCLLESQEVHDVGKITRLSSVALDDITNMQASANLVLVHHPMAMTSLLRRVTHVEEADCFAFIWLCMYKIKSTVLKQKHHG